MRMRMRSNDAIRMRQPVQCTGFYNGVWRSKSNKCMQTALHVHHLQCLRMSVRMNDALPAVLLDAAIPLKSFSIMHDAP